MQTFLPYPDFAQSAACLDNKRLGKQRIECLQILNVLACGPFQRAKRPSTFEFLHWESCPEREMHEKSNEYLYRKTPWYNHPAVKMWKRHKHALALYGCHICFEWRDRGYQDNVVQKIRSIVLWTNDLEIRLRKIKFDAEYPKYDYPSWLGNEAFHASHRSNLLRKNPTYYGQFGWTEPNNLPYIWPII